MSEATTLPQTLIKPVPRGGYTNFVGAAFGHALLMMLRRQRIILASVICLLPVLLPLALAFLSTSEFAADGGDYFVRLAEYLHIAVLAPLLALFFATMLVGEDAESQTIPYVLTRPTPRSAWVIGRFLAYLLTANIILGLSMALTYGASTTLKGLGFSPADLKLAATYLFVAFLALMGYGAFTMFLGAVSKRPIVVGVVFIYGWQKVALFVPGLISSVTIEKYIAELLPEETTALADRAAQSDNAEVLAALEELRLERLTADIKAGVTLLLIVALLIGITVFTVRFRQYAAAKAAGA